MLETEATKTAVGHVTLTVPAHLDYSAAIRDFTLASLKNVGGFDGPWASRMQLAVDELFMNAVRYGSGPESMVELRFDFAPHRVAIAVDDAGEGPTRVTARMLGEHVQHARKEHEERQKSGQKNFALSGRGLSQLVASWADHMRFEDSPLGGVRVTIMKTL